jgi:hypothetical protein
MTFAGMSANGQDAPLTDFRATVFRLPNPILVGRYTGPFIPQSSRVRRTMSPLIVAIVIDRPGIRDFIKKDDCLVARQKPRNDIDRLRSIRVRASLP